MVDELAALKKEQKRLEAAIKTKEEIIVTKAQVKKNTERLKSLESELHPTEFQKVTKAAVNVTKLAAEGTVQGANAFFKFSQFLKKRHAAQEKHRKQLEKVS